jgi:glyoxylase-like metal-dependent hydrolase (beta-lactamase superfamily II)
MPEDIDVVINTHLHFDHCGWNTVRGKNGKIVPTFPRAKYYAPEGEWQYARRPSERDAISYIPDNYDPLVAGGQMTLLKGGEEIVPGISVQTFPGHTAHMQAVIVTSGGRTACYISDLIPTAAHIDIAWGMGFDLYPLQTIESKKHYYAKSIPEKWLTVFTHDARMPWAYVEQDELGKMVALGV